MPPYKHSRQRLKNQERGGRLCLRREVCVPLPATSCRKWNLHWDHQPKQSIWNPANYSHRHSTANVNLNPATAALSFQQSFSRLTSKSPSESFFEDYLWSPHYTTWQILRDDDASASRTCSQPASPVPALPNRSQLQTSSGITKQQATASPDALILTPPSSEHLHHPLQQTRSCNSNLVHEWPLCPD